MSVLAIDAGTSSCKVGVFAAEGMVASAGRDYPILSPRPGYAELDPADVWDKIKDCVREAAAAAKGKADRIAAVSFSSMGEVMVPVTGDRRIVGPGILSYDVRGAEYAERLAGDFGQDEFYAINPNLIGPYFALSKLMWMKDHARDVFDQSDRMLAFGDFVGFMLGAEPYACTSLANRTLLLDVRKGDWSDRLLAWSGIPREKLGRMMPGGAVAGTVSRAMADELGLEGGVDIVVGGHDQCCNALGCGCTGAGLAAAGLGTYETYCPVLAWPEDAKAYLGEIHNLENHVVAGLYVSFLYNHSGLLANWFRKAFAPELTAERGRDAFAVLGAEMPEEPTNILFFPHNEPPQWPEFVGDTSGVFVGLKTATTRGDMYKALVEGTTMYFVDAIASLNRMGIDPEVFLASGGASRSDAQLQIKADIIGVPFARLETGEGSLTGAEMLAAARAGVFSGFEEAAAAWVRRGRVFTPDPARRAYYRESAALYKRILPALHPLMKTMTARGKF